MQRQYRPSEGLSRREFLAAAPGFAAAPKRLPRELAADAQRPKCHLLPPANWMNDPNGPIFWKGRYHMFYQHNPGAAVWGNMHWGHAISPDMVHWRHMPMAFAPQPGSYDKDGVWSGCAVVNRGVPTVVYTATMPEVQCIATSRSDDLRSWRRSEKNPVLAKPPEGIAATGFRDPCLWQEDGVWHMALGCGIRDKGGVVLHYRGSEDLHTWEYIGLLHEGRLDPDVKSKDAVARGEMWECPSFFPLGDKWVLFVSTQGTTPYWVGTWSGGRFQPESEGRLDTGAYYAPITQLDAQGRRILWGWITERRSREEQVAAGWSGVMSLPRVLTVHDGHLHFAPAQQVRALRGPRQQFVNLFASDGAPQRVPQVQGDALELIAEFEPGDAEEFGLEVLNTRILYNARADRLVAGTERAQNLRLPRNEPLRLNVFADCSVVEVFANGRACITARSYPAAPAECPVSITARGGTARVKSLTVFELKPISSDRLTT